METLLAVIEVFCMQNFRINFGFSVVEIVVAASIFLVTIAAFIVSFDTLRSLDSHTEDRTLAALLLEEGGEAVLLLRDLSWEDNIAGADIDTTYYLYWDGSNYVLSEEEIVISSRYVRTVVFSRAYRDGSGYLSSTGSEDENTRRAVVSIVSAIDGTEIVKAEMLVHNSYE